MKRKPYTQYFLLIFAVTYFPLQGQTLEQYQGPIIDMHMHTITETWDEDHVPVNPVTSLPSAASTGEDVLRQTILEMNKHNVVVGFLSGYLDSVISWKQKYPERFIASVHISMAQKGPFELFEYWPELDLIKTGVENDVIQGLGEFNNEYAGMKPGDDKLDPYFRLAEQFDLPVGIHTGNGTIFIINDEQKKRYRVDNGNPLHVNEIIAKYPELRINLMHAGYPYLDNTIALMKVYTNIYADLSRMNWHSATRVAFHNYLKALIDAGLGNRLMFGSDGAGYPEAIRLAIEGLDSAPFLNQEQKADIFYNNAARFLRFTEEQIAKHHN